MSSEISARLDRGWLIFASGAAIVVGRLWPGFYSISYSSNKKAESCKSAQTDCQLISKTWSAL